MRHHVALPFAAKDSWLQNDLQKASSYNGTFNSGGNKTRGSRAPAQSVSTDFSSLAVFLWGSPQAQWILLWELDFPSALLQGTKFQFPFHCNNKRRLIPCPVETPKFVSFPVWATPPSDTFAFLYFQNIPFEVLSLLLIVLCLPAAPIPTLL